MALRRLRILLLGAALSVGAFVASPAARAGAEPPPAPTTTVAGIAGQLPSAPSTVPFRTRTQSAHIDPIFARLSIAGFAVVLLLATIQAILTRKSRRGRWTL